MIDLSLMKTTHKIRFYLDASATAALGFGCILDKNWIFSKWEDNFIETVKPSIEFLELYALCAGIFTWENHDSLTNCHITVFCDNTAVVNMINNITSKCKLCMYLIRMIVLNGLIFNRRLNAKYVKSKENGLADSLSRMQLDRFKLLDPTMNEKPDKISEKIWPPSEIIKKANAT